MEQKAVSKAKAPNYTEEQVAEMEERYKANPTRETVNQIAKDFGKGERSVIAKLSRMKIYVVPPRTTKAGKPIIRKETLVENICKRLEVDLPSLVKTNKQDLEKLTEVLNEWFGDEDV